MVEHKFSGLLLWHAIVDIVIYKLTYGLYPGGGTANRGMTVLRGALDDPGGTVLIQIFSTHELLTICETFNLKYENIDG